MSPEEVGRVDFGDMGGADDFDGDRSAFESAEQSERPAATRISCLRREPLRLRCLRCSLSRWGSLPSAIPTPPTATLLRRGRCQRLTRFSRTPEFVLSR